MAKPERPNAKKTEAVTPVRTAEARTREVMDRLLDAATELFMEKGYDTTSMAEISARAHASKETIYRHYATKDELYRAVVLRRAEMVANDLETGLPAHELPERALQVFGEHIVTNMTTAESIAFHRVLGMTKDRFPELMELYRRTGPHHRVRDVLARYLTGQVKSGQLRKLDAEVAARQFFDLVGAEMIINAHFSGKTNPPRAAIRQRVKEGVDCFLHGYAGGMR